MNNKEFEPIRIRIMQEAYELADRGDVEGYNAVKVMCNDVQNLLKREWVELTNKEMKAIVKAHDVILTGKMWVFIADLIDELKEKNT